MDYYKPFITGKEAIKSNVKKIYANFNKPRDEKFIKILKYGNVNLFSGEIYNLSRHKKLEGENILEVERHNDYFSIYKLSTKRALANSVIRETVRILNNPKKLTELLEDN